MCFKLRSLVFDIFLWWFTNRPFRIFARMPMSYGTILNILRISVCCFRSRTYWSYILFKTTISKFFLASANTKCLIWENPLVIEITLSCFIAVYFLKVSFAKLSFYLFETIRPWRTLARVNSFGSIFTKSYGKLVTFNKNVEFQFVK